MSGMISHSSWWSVFIDIYYRIDWCAPWVLIWFKTACLVNFLLTGFASPKVYCSTTMFVCCFAATFFLSNLKILRHAYSVTIVCYPGFIFLTPPIIKIIAVSSPNILDQNIDKISRWIKRARNQISVHHFRPKIYRARDTTQYNTAAQTAIRVGLLQLKQILLHIWVNF